MLELLAREGQTAVYRLLGYDYYLIYQARPVGRPGRPRLDLDGDTTRMIFTQLAETGHLRFFYGRNCMRTAEGKWLPIEAGNLAELLSSAGYFLAVGPAALSEAGVPGLAGRVQEIEDPRAQVKEYLGCLQAAGILAQCPPSQEWERTFIARSLTIPEVRGVLRHPVFPPGGIEGWLDERPDLVLPEAGAGFPHLERLFSSIELDAASRCALYSYLFGAFHRCSLNEPRPLLMVDSREQQCGKSITGEAIAVLVDEEPRTLTLDRDANEAEEIVAQLAHGTRCLVIPNLTRRRNWNNTLLATLCTDLGQARRLKYTAKATTFYGTLGISSTVLGTSTLHRDLITRLWRVALANVKRPRLEVVPSAYAREHRLALLAEIMQCHALAEPYHDSFVTTRFPTFEKAGCAAYAVFAGLPHEIVGGLMERAERARYIFRDEVMASLWCARPELFADRCNWPAIPQGAEWLKDYDGAHAFGYTLKEGKWTP